MPPLTPLTLLEIELLPTMGPLSLLASKPLPLLALRQGVAVYRHLALFALEPTAVMFYLSERHPESRVSLGQIAVSSRRALLTPMASPLPPTIILESRPLFAPLAIATATAPPIPPVVEAVATLIARREHRLSELFVLSFAIAFASGLIDVILGPEDL